MERKAGWTQPGGWTPVPARWIAEHVPAEWLARRVGVVTVMGTEGKTGKKLLFLFTSMILGEFQEFLEE